MSHNGRIKVIEFIPTLATGGAEALVRDYCLLFDKNKIDVQVVVVDHRYGTHNERILEEQGIKVTYLSEKVYGNRYELNIFQKLVRRISRYYYWRKIVKEEQPDVIHLHLHLGKYMKILPLHKLRTKPILTVHNVIPNYFSKEKTDCDKYKEYREVYRLVHRHNMLLITLHQQLAEELKQFFETQNVTTVNNGIVLDTFCPALYDKEEVRQELGIKQDEFLIGNVASLSPQKNHSFILDVFAQLVKQYPTAKLLLVGQGELKRSIQDRIGKEGVADKVILLSNRGDVARLMSAMDVFFFPSLWEGFGNVMIEAQSMGLKCVVSENVPDCTRVSDKVVVCNLDDSMEEWIEALTEASYPANQKECDIEEYDMKNVVSRLQEIYSSVTNEL